MDTSWDGVAEWACRLLGWVKQYRCGVEGMMM